MLTCWYVRYTLAVLGLGIYLACGSVAVLSELQDSAFTALYLPPPLTLTP